MVLVPVAAGTVNTSYVAQLAGGERLFLRLYEDQDVAGARREARLLGTLAARGVPTPSPLSGPTGADAVSVVRGKALVAFPVVEGSTPRQSEVTPSHTHAVGAALARLHLAVDGLPAPEGRFGVDALVERVRGFARSDSPAVRELAPVLERDLLAAQAARALTLPGGLIHGDLFRDNVLFQGDRLVALLDFESCQRAPFVYDLAVVLLSWCFASEFEWPLARALFAGYAGVRPPSAEETHGLFAEARFACLRFATTRIADETWRAGKHHGRFLERLAALDALGAHGLRARVES